MDWDIRCNTLSETYLFLSRRPLSISHGVALWINSIEIYTRACCFPRRLMGYGFLVINSAVADACRAWSEERVAMRPEQPDGSYTQVFATMQQG